MFLPFPLARFSSPLWLLTRLVFQSDYDQMTQNRLKLGLATPLNIKLRTARKNIIKSTAGAVHWERQSLWTESLKKKET